MTTNSKEYMREYQRQRRAKLKFIKEDVKKSVKNVKKYVKISELKPPKVEKEDGASIERKTRDNGVRSFSLSPTNSKTFMGIDFNRIADLSSFRMFIQEVIKTSLPGFEGVPTRGKKKVVTEAFNKRILYWKEVQEEMKEVLKKRRLNKNELG